MIKVNFNEAVGKIKPMNAVNNGPTPASVRGTSNFELFKKANIPYARLHDSAFSTFYGGEWTVDVHRIFRDFAADENDPDSYDFGETDKYLATIIAAGVEPFYRLGCNIEHGKKYGTYPPADFYKWARICERIIAHYVEGWANGFNYKIDYWEIWNEPDCQNADGSNPCWQGTPEQFGEFFAIAAKHLKARFPQLKIGGPAFAWMGGNCDGTARPEVAAVLDVMKREKVELDFVSYHCYTESVEGMIWSARNAASIYEAYGFGGCEKILNEWSYVRGWLGADWIYTCESEQGKKGAAFYSASMNALQRENVDMLMYYDARPNTVMNGMFDQFLRPIRGYHSIAAFGELLSLGTCVQSSDEKNVYACAAKGDGGKEVLISYFNDDDSSPSKTVTVELDGCDDEVEVYYLGDGGFELRSTTDARSFDLTLDLFDVVKIIAK